MNDHFSPVANPAPPRPRCPDALTSLMMASRPRAKISLVPSQAPRRRAPSRPQSCWPYRFLKMRSLSASMTTISIASRIGGVAFRRLGHRRIAQIGRLARFFRVVVGAWRRLALTRLSVRAEQRRIGEGRRTADRGGIDAIDLRPRFRPSPRRKIVDDPRQYFRRQVFIVIGVDLDHRRIHAS